MLKYHGSQEQTATRERPWSGVDFGVGLTFAESQCTLEGETVSCRRLWHGTVGRPPSSGTARSSAQGCVSMLADAASSGVPPLRWHVCVMSVRTLDLAAVGVRDGEGSERTSCPLGQAKTKSLKHVRPFKTPLKYTVVKVANVRVIEVCHYATPGDRGPCHGGCSPSTKETCTEILKKTIVGKKLNNSDLFTSNLQFNRDIFT